MTLEWNGAAYLRRVAEAIDGAVKDCAGLLAEASLREVPVDTAALHNSCKIVKVGDGDYIVSYGDDKTDAYAVVQHEDLSLNHIHGGKAKYLEDPFNRLKQGFVESIAKAVTAV